MLKPISGWFQISPEDEPLLNEQRALTGKVNENFIQVGAVFLKPAGKTPYEGDWFTKNYRDTNLQSWIDDPECRPLNVGFNLQMGWVDVDIDSEDPEYNRCIIAALKYTNNDTRFQFGRRSVGVPSHLLVQLSEEEAAIWNVLKKLEPSGFSYRDKKFKTELRSFATNGEVTNLYKEARQTVMPGSVYLSKSAEGQYDISVWYQNGVEIAHQIGDIAATTPHKTRFSRLTAGIALGTIVYIVKDKWVEGSRQEVAGKISGWLARVVEEGNALNNNPNTHGQVLCPIDQDEAAEAAIRFICEYLEDDEAHMRVRTYYDARAKLERNPDAKIPGWPTMSMIFGDEAVNALRTVLMPGSDVSILTKLAEQYVYSDLDDRYIDREMFWNRDKFAYESTSLERRHKPDMIFTEKGNKPAWRIFESSSIRRRVTKQDLYPEFDPGTIIRINPLGKAVHDDSEERSSLVFNTWVGWPYKPAVTPNKGTLAKCNSMLDQLFKYLTRDNEDQATWLRKWLAWIIQNPADKQQVSPVIVGGQGIGKSFFGHTFLRSLMLNLAGAATPNALDGKFMIEPFLDKMIVFIDEARFHNEASVDVIKNMIRNVDQNGQEKFKKARDYRIFSRILFASNRLDMNVGQANIQDRALFYIKAYDSDHLNMGGAEFRRWAVTLKPYFDEFNDMLKSREVCEHFMRIFIDTEVDRHELEDVSISAAQDPDIIDFNMAVPRRIAKAIIEEARILEDTDITAPFTKTDLNERVADTCKAMGLFAVQGVKVLTEFRDAGVLEDHTEDGQHFLRFKYKLGTLTENYGQAISARMEPRFEFTDADFGDNEATRKTPISWRGLNRSVFRKI